VALFERWLFLKTDERSNGFGVPESSPSLSGRRVTWLAYSGILLEGIVVGWIGPLLPQIARAMRVPIDHAGLVVSAVSIGYFAALTIAGEASEKIGPQTTMSTAMLLVTAGFGGLAIAPVLALMLASAFIMGLGFGAVDVAGNAVVVELNRARLASALNYLHLMFGVGALLGPLIVGFALATHVSYSLLFALGAGVAAAVTLALFVTPQITREAHLAHEAGGFLPILAHPLAWILAAVLFLYVGAENGIGAWLFLFLHIKSVLSETISSWGVSLYWGGLIAGRFAGARLAHRIAPRPFTLMASILAAVALAIMIATPDLHVIAALAIFLIGFGYGPIFPNMVAVGAEQFPAEVGRITSIVVAGGALGGAFVPWLMGHEIVVAGLDRSMMLALAITILMTIVALGTFRVPSIQRANAT
jgi:MFS transporter, FHS family, glucose/mannose:H+ symporter